MKDFNENQQEKGTSLIKSMPQSAQNDTYLGNNFCKNTKKSIKNISFLRKPRVFKVIAASGLALFMGVGVLCGVLIAPMHPTKANVLTENRMEYQEDKWEGADRLIYPQEDDPVICMTDFGIEIKWSNTFSVDTFNSGNLLGFPYFVLDGYTWVVIGRSTTAFTDIITYKPISYYLNDSTISPKIYSGINKESNTPAGNATYNQIQTDYCATANGAYDIKLSSLNCVKPNTEIDTGCVLCLANGVISSGIAANLVSMNYAWKSTNCWYNDSIKSVMDNYYTKSLLGLANIKTRIQPNSITTSGCGMQKNSSGLLSAEVFTVTQKNCYVFPLSYAGTFKYSNYLTADQIKLSSNQWLSDGVQDINQCHAPTDTTLYYYKYYINELGKPVSMFSTETAGYRPAFELKLAH
ncbi:MAG: hypothetical protein J6A98_02255 [Clostridia bacterium]|nr:hypothetical protein [Clostridia bacterium]